MARLIARGEQLKQLSATLQNAGQGRLQIVFVTGEAGAGKSVLIDAFVEKVKGEMPSWLVAGSKCHAIAGGHQEPYLPFVQILQALMAEKGDNTLTTSLSRIVSNVAPDWIAAIPGVGGVVAAATRTVQATRQEFSDQGTGIDTQRRMVQYTNALKQIASAWPLLLWIDDLHWSDSATLNLISFLADHAAQVPIMLIAAYRPTDMIEEKHGQPHPVQRLVNKLSRYQQSSAVAVPNFSRADVDQLLSLSKHNFPEAFASRLHRSSGGNPLFVRQYINLLHARRLLKREGGAFVLMQSDVEVEIPPTIQAVISQRLSLIGKPMRRLLSYASVQGERFASRVLTSLLEAGKLDVLEQLNQLSGVHGLIHELPEQHLMSKVGTEYQFVHVLIQQALYDALSVGQRRYLHLTIAQLLETFYGEDVEQYAADIAIHFERGGNLAQAISYYLQASRNALDVYALDDALNYAQGGQRLADQMGEDERAIGWHVDALVKIAEVLILKSEYEAALTTCDEGEKLCQIVGLIEQHASLLYWRAIGLIRQGYESQAIEPIKQAIDLVSDVPINPRLLGLLYSRLSWLLRYFPLAEVLQYLEKALSIAQIHDLPEIKAKTLRRRAWVEIYRQDKPIQAHKLGQDSLIIAQKYNLVYEQILSHRIIAFTYHRLRRFDSAFWHCEEAVKIARQSGLPIGLHIGLESLAVSWLEAREEWQMSLEAVREAIAVAEKYNFPPTYTALGVWFKSAFGLGRWQEAREAQEYRLKLMAFNHTKKAFYSWRQGHFAYVQGRFKESVNLYEKAFLLFNRLRSDERDSRRVQPYLGLALVAKGDLQPAIKHLHSACAYWQGRQDAKFAQSLRALARINLIQGETTQAVARLREALAVADNSYEEENIFPVWPCTCIDLGRALLTTGETNKALQHALAGYGKFKKWGHFLLGEAAFVVGQILMAQGKQDEALTYLQSAHNEWQRLGLTHHLPAWEAFMQKHGLL